MDQNDFVAMSLGKEHSRRYPPDESYSGLRLPFAEANCSKLKNAGNSEDQADQTGLAMGPGLAEDCLEIKARGLRGNLQAIRGCGELVSSGQQVRQPALHRR